jgi:hypothetical protein
MWMNDQLQMFNPETSLDTLKRTGSLEEDFGVLPSAKPAGPMSARSGREAAPAPALARRAKERGLTILATSGLLGRDSSASADLQQSLESRLLPRLDTAGSTLFRLTWRQRTTPLGRRYLERAASALRTSGSGFTSWPTATTGTQRTPESPEARKKRGFNHGVTLTDAASLATWATPAERDYRTANLKNFAERGGGRKGEQLQNQVKHLAGWPTPSVVDDNNSRRGPESVQKQIDRENPMNSLAIKATLSGPVRLTAGGEMLTGSDAGMESSGQLNPEHSLWLQGIPAVWVSFALRAMQSVSRRRKRSSKRT